MTTLLVSQLGSFVPLVLEPERRTNIEFEFVISSLWEMSTRSIVHRSLSRGAVMAIALLLSGILTSCHLASIAITGLR